LQRQGGGGAEEKQKGDSEQASLRGFGTAQGKSNGGKANASRKPLNSGDQGFGHKVVFHGIREKE
jgi:hypothetical protein